MLSNLISDDRQSSRTTTLQALQVTTIIINCKAVFQYYNKAL